MSAVSPKNLQVAQILQEDVSSQIHDCHPGHCVPSLYQAMTGVWPGDTSHHTPGLCHRKTEQKLSEWASLTTATGKNWGMRRNKTSQWGKKQPWSRPGPGKWRQGLEEMRITRVWDVATIAWSEPPCTQCPPVITCLTQLSFLSAVNCSPQVPREPRTLVTISVMPISEKTSVSVWTIFFLSDFFTSPHLPGAGYSCHQRPRSE